MISEILTVTKNICLLTTMTAIQIFSTIFLKKIKTLRNKKQKLETKTCINKRNFKQIKNKSKTNEKKLTHININVEEIQG